MAVLVHKDHKVLLGHKDLRVHKVIPVSKDLKE
jgi:hypothetical protein